MKPLPASFFTCFLFLGLTSGAQHVSNPSSGNLFIIGGGDRSPELMRTLLHTAALKPNDYVAVLPMSSESPDTSYYYFKEDFEPVCSCAIINFNISRENSGRKSYLDSLQHARLIFITGGDQARFMGVVLNTPVYTAIHVAYSNGATIAGTSAGAAVMSRYMITGNQLTDTNYHATFSMIHGNNIEIKEGLGLLQSAIIDQHFVVRSRYNRLFSALAQFPGYPCIGIDEATAIIVHGNRVKVTGESQVIFMRHPEKIEITSNGLVKFKNLQFSMYTSGDEFLLDK